MFEIIGAVMIVICLCSSAAQIVRILRLAHIDR